jgi:DNA ligase D-like protein (predicted 3'-phosphoesterase)
LSKVRAHNANPGKKILEPHGLRRVFSKRALQTWPTRVSAAAPPEGALPVKNSIRHVRARAQQEGRSVGHRSPPLNQHEDRNASRAAVGRPAGAQAGGRYLVNEHGTDSQHFEFQLEIADVLKSWTVIRGPSLDPDIKRLAVRTEDRPADSGHPDVRADGECARRTILVWDQGSWTPRGDPKDGLERGHLQFELNGERLHGVFSLVRLGGKAARENWFLIKSRDAHVERTDDGKELWDWSPGRRGSKGRRGRKASPRSRVGDLEGARGAEKGEDPS